MRILAIDQGTTSTRAILFEDGRHRPVGAHKHRTRHPQPGRVEQDASELLANIAALIEAAGHVDAIALDNQGESCLAWDARSGEPLSPVVVWQDVRTAEDLARMAQTDAAALSRDLAALPLDPYFSASKLGWLLRENEAVKQAAGRGRLRMGTTDAFFLDRLAGTFATDCATASRTGLMNIETGQWDSRLCALFGVPPESLPEIRTNIAGFGAVGGVPVAAAIVDQQAALYGHGARGNGDAKITFGTGAFALAVTGGTLHRGALDKGILPTLAWNLGNGPVHAIDGGVQDAGSAVEWALRAGLAEKLADFDAVPDRSAIARGLVFAPLFSGLGCPHWDRSAAPILLGLQPDMGKADMRQALLEGIAFLTADVIEAMEDICPIGDTLSIDGGLSNNCYFAQFLANCLGKTIRVDGFAERTAFGAASLGALALGRTLSLETEPATLFRPQAFTPDLRHRFQDALRRAQNWR